MTSGPADPSDRHTCRSTRPLRIAGRRSTRTPKRHLHRLRFTGRRDPGILLVLVRQVRVLAAPVDCGPGQPRREVAPISLRQRAIQNMRTRAEQRPAQPDQLLTRVQHASVTVRGPRFDDEHGGCEPGRRQDCYRAQVIVEFAEDITHDREVGGFTTLVGMPSPGSQRPRPEVHRCGHRRVGGGDAPPHFQGCRRPVEDRHHALGAECLDRRPGPGARAAAQIEHLHRVEDGREDGREFGQDPAEHRRGRRHPVGGIRRSLDLLPHDRGTDGGWLGRSISLDEPGGGGSERGARIALERRGESDVEAGVIPPNASRYRGGSS